MHLSADRAGGALDDADIRLCEVQQPQAAPVAGNQRSAQHFVESEVGAVDHLLTADQSPPRQAAVRRIDHAPFVGADENAVGIRRVPLHKMRLQNRALRKGIQAAAFHQVCQFRNIGPTGATSGADLHLPCAHIRRDQVIGIRRVHAVHHRAHERPLTHAIDADVVQAAIGRADDRAARPADIGDLPQPDYAARFLHADVHGGIRRRSADARRSPQWLADGDTGHLCPDAAIVEGDV